MDLNHIAEIRRVARLANDLADILAITGGVTTLLLTTLTLPCLMRLALRLASWAMRRMLPKPMHWKNCGLARTANH